MRPACPWPILLALACGSRTAATEGDSASASDAASTAASTAGTIADATASSGPGTGEASDEQTSCAALCSAYDTCAPELSGPDGVEGKTCPADGICTNTGELGTKMLTCCG